LRAEGLVAGDYQEWLKRLVPAAERAEMERIAGALQARHPAFERFQPERPLPFIELDDEDLQVQVNICAHSVDVTMPYVRANARDMLHAVRICIEVLEKEAGLLAYDPQLDRMITAADVTAMYEQYRATDSVLPQIRGLGNKPWWKFW
jgi:hypothetical protein